jgi:hypothetical protein
MKKGAAEEEEAMEGNEERVQVMSLLFVVFSFPSVQHFIILFPLALIHPRPVPPPPSPLNRKYKPHKPHKQPQNAKPNARREEKVRKITNSPPPNFSLAPLTSLMQIPHQSLFFDFQS